MVKGFSECHQPRQTRCTARIPFLAHRTRFRARRYSNCLADSPNQWGTSPTFTPSLMYTSTRCMYRYFTKGNVLFTHSIINVHFPPVRRGGTNPVYHSPMMTVIIEKQSQTMLTRITALRIHVKTPWYDPQKVNRNW